MMIGYTFLQKHNPDINWEKGEWQFTRCPESCQATKSRKAKMIDAETNKLNLFKSPYESVWDMDRCPCVNIVMNPLF
jgi:hypothetical protein